MLLHFGVKPYLVFDGDYLPSKRGTEQDRAARRKEAKAAGLELLQMGKKEQAQIELQKGVDVTPSMAKQLIDELVKANVDFIVAPYEADPQLVYLEKQGIIDGIISEDSDMLVFGSKVLLTKLEAHGDCIAIHRKDFAACREVSFIGWTDAEFRWMSILSGCDYLAPIGNVGLKTAHRLIRKHRTVERLVKALQFDGKAKIAPGYLDAFRDAELTFLHQWVYCPIKKDVVNINPIPNSTQLENMPFIGSRPETSIAQLVARGRLDPHTKQPLIAAASPPIRQWKNHDKSKKKITSTPELKHSHSIESFFKPKRTPLAELDPNSFTPSPSQQRLIDAQPREWLAVSANPRPQLLSRSVTEVRNSSSNRRITSDSWSPLGEKASKRQRLCSDASFDVQNQGNDLTTTLEEKSKFFKRPSNIGDSAVFKSTRPGGRRKSEFNIWSDDSIEEAMSQITDDAILLQPPPRDVNQEISKTLTEETISTDSQQSHASVQTAVWSNNDESSSFRLESFTYDDAVTNEHEAKPEPLDFAEEFKPYLLQNTGSTEPFIPHNDNVNELQLLDSIPSFGQNLSKFAFLG